MKRTLPDGEGRQIVVGLSGGVDSAVSAWLLKEAGWQVTGLFMKNWEDDDDSEYCSSRQDWLDAASVADVIGILAGHKDGWGMAYWFQSVNGFLGGKRPQDLLATDPDRVIAAARDEVLGVLHG